MRTPWLGKYVGFIVLGVALLLAVGLYTLLAGAVTPSGDSESWDLGVVRVPHGRLDLHPALFIATAVVVGIGILAVFVVERLLTLRAAGYFGDDVPLAPRRSGSPLAAALTGDVVRVPQESFGRLVVLIPAHNEEHRIRETLAGLQACCPPEVSLLVVADNCTDRTVEYARAAGVKVMSTVGNRERKAGALNQALALLLPGMDNQDLIMVVDADTVLSQGFVTTVLAEFEADADLMAVGGLFQGDDTRGLVAECQRNEYIRYEREVLRAGGRVSVLTGTASAFRVRALAEVATSRGVLIPGRPGDVYDTAALTEDNELTLALKSLGARMVSPSACTVTTELMPTLRNLWVQRLRWQRGAVENIGAYGMTSATARSWLQQVGLAYGVLGFGSFLLLLVLSALWFQWSDIYVFWVAVGLIFALERVITVWDARWRGRVLAALLLPELIYAVFLSAVFVKGIWNISRGKTAHWGHVENSGITGDQQGSVA